MYTYMGVKYGKCIIVVWETAEARRVSRRPKTSLRAVRDRN